MTGDWRKLHSEELHSVHYSPGMACRTDEGRRGKHTGFWRENRKEGGH
jgi:hypothetical protein